MGDGRERVAEQKRVSDGWGAADTFQTGGLNALSLKVESVTATYCRSGTTDE